MTVTGTYKGLTSLLEASPLFWLYILLHADHLRLSFVQIKHLADGVRTYVVSRFDDVELLRVATLGKLQALEHFQRLGVGLHLLQYRVANHECGVYIREILRVVVLGVEIFLKKIIHHSLSLSVVAARGYHTEANNHA